MTVVCRAATDTKAMLMSDFGALPPEINSARMYAGPGSGPLLASAAAWDALAAELEMFGAGYCGAISALQGESWSGGASTAMADAAAPYVAWVTTTAGQAGQSASQARAAAAAYEAAFAATVPPAVVMANRTLLATLVATNVFGQNTPAIAATEAGYAEMWAQDAAAMYGYAASASAAATLTSFGQPPQTTNPAGQSSQGGAVGQAVDTSIGHSQTTLSQLMSAVPQRLQTLASAPLPNSSEAEASATPTSTTATSTPIITAVTDLDELLGSTILTFAVPKTVFQGGSFVLASQGTGAQATTLPAMPGPAESAAAIAQTWPPADLSNSVFASVGRAAPVGGLSVPQNWTTATPPAGPTTEPVAPAKTSFRALPPWANPTDTRTTNTSAGMPATARITNAPSGRGSNTVFRMRDRRYRMPRPTLGG
jgi:PPE-repeat protein